jgi:hypothetical protein
MKSRKESIIIELTPTLHLFISGIFTPHYSGKWTTFAESEPSEPAEFEIINVEIDKGSVTELLDWNDGWLHSQISNTKHRLKENKSHYEQSLYEYLEEKCLEKIE